LERGVAKPYPTVWDHPIDWSRAPASEKINVMSHRICHRCLAAALSLLVAAGCSDSPTAPELAGSSRAQLQAQTDSLVSLGVPGIILLVKDRSRSITLTSGVSSLTATTSMRPNDRFRIGSLTKTYLSAIVLQLVAESRVSLDDRVERWVPGAISNGGSITIRQLLNHTSGIFDYYNDPRVLAPYFGGDFAFAWAPRQLIAIADSHGPDSTPGTVQEYSNSNYTLLGLVVEEVTGRTLSQVTQERLFAPLGLAHSTFAMDANPDQSRARGYLLSDGDPLDVSDLFPFYWGAGNIVSDAADVARFCAALLDGQLLPAPLLAAMKAPVAGTTNNYGFGLIRTPTPCGNAYGHDGATPGYSADVLAVGGGRVVVAFSNALTFADSHAVNPAADTLWQRMLFLAACG